MLSPRYTLPEVEPIIARAANLGDRAYEHLRELILRREILGGSEVPESDIAAHLKVSRTPMREALIRLVGEGLLERTADRAYRVRRVSVREFFECMQLREVLECLALEKAVPEIDREELDRLRQELVALGSSDDDMAHWNFDCRFHGFFAAAAGHDMLAATIARLRVIARLFRISSSLHRQAEIGSEHLAILDAVSHGSVADARLAMLVHLGNLQDDVRRAVAREADPENHFNQPTLQ